MEPTKEQFIDLSRQGKFVPVYTRIIDDLNTPVSATMALARGGESFLLESVEGGENVGRYCFIGLSPHTTIKGSEGVVTIRRDGAAHRRDYGGDPLAPLKDLLAEFAPVPDPRLPPFSGGAVGFMAYDLVRSFERLPALLPNDLGTPDFYFVFPEIVVIFDRVTHHLTIVTHARGGDDPAAAYEKARSRVESTARELQESTVKRPIRPLPPLSGELPSNFPEGAFQDAVRRCREYILDGDILQVVLSRRFSVDFPGEPIDIYRRLRATNPSPYMFLLDFEELKLIGTSPEVHVKAAQGKVSMRPIAGTRPRGKTPEEDAALARELLADEKERAEHLMLVDLGRNDLSRVCVAGSVNLTEFMTVERYSHVMHIVSNLEGILKEGHDIFDLIRATFPAGTVSGAPKVRAMEIIEELEPVRRGPYAGILAYFSNVGNLDSCITIRTIVLKDGKAHIQAGAGIVADSDPDAELEETRNKAMALVNAVGHIPGK